MTFEKDAIGIVGHGFVGEALEKGMKHAFKVLVYDPYKYPTATQACSVPGRTRVTSNDLEIVGSMEELAQRAEVIFVCVPTPMRSDGSCDTSNVASVVRTLDALGSKNVAVIKSTVPPGTTEGLHRECKKLKGVTFNPEFLTEANYIEDFKNQSRIIIGGEEPAKSVVKKLYSKAYPKVPTIKTNSTIAEMVKYTTNCFLATKVTFANEIFQVCEKLNIDYDKVIEYARYDERLGQSHWAVPGPDGDFGFGLSCFPKDLNALIFRAKEMKVEPKVMSAVWQKNLEVRRNRDWEKMSKAVVNPVKQDPEKPVK